MKVSEAIDQLAVGDTVWVKGKIYDIDQSNVPMGIEFEGPNYWFDKGQEISLSEPQAEKVEVPGFIDKLIRKYKARNETLFCSIADLYNDSDEYKWYVDNVEIYERAWVNGYTVKPKRWVVKDSDGQYVYDLHLNHVISAAHSSYDTKLDVLTFTDKSKAEAVAVLVEGSVEEV